MLPHPSHRRDARREPGSSIAVLLSGGLDSAVFLGEALDCHRAVYPLYVRCGLRWEAEELHVVQQFLRAVATPRLRPLSILELPMRPLYAEHWSTQGTDVPDRDTPDEAVYLPGRNVALLTQAMLWCHLRGVPTVAIATLRGNPFPDATSDFIAGLERVVNQGIAGQVRIVQPYATLDKVDVVRRGRRLPLALTLSCLSPIDGMHCGQCNKCAERQQAFRKAGIDDPTTYLGSPSYVGVYA